MDKKISMTVEEEVLQKAMTPVLPARVLGVEYVIDISVETCFQGSISERKD